MDGSAATTVYFHGLPGSAADLTGFGRAIAGSTSAWHVVDRSAMAEGGFASLARRIDASKIEGSIHLVGFSLGAAAALRVLPFLETQVERVDLVSPAAPLHLGDFLGDMAGASVFRAARSGNLPFMLFAQAQALAARISSPALAKGLMARARGADAGLAQDSQFLDSLAQSLRTTLRASRRAYCAEIAHYVADWRPALMEVRQPVTIWQGTEDDWTPPAMAKALAQALPGGAAIEWRDGLSHFSTLRAYLVERAE